MALDLGTLGTAAGVLTTIGTAAWAWWERTRKNHAETKADVAQSDAERAVADSQTTVYKLLTDRLAMVEKDVTVLRTELAAERAHSRKLEMHIWRLENLMRASNLTVPEFNASNP